MKRVARWRWLAGAALALAAVYAAAILVAHRTPPLRFAGGASNLVGDRYVIGLRLQNDGWFPVVLERAEVAFVPGAEITAVVSFFNPRAGGMCEVASAAVYPDYCPDRQEDEVAGWRVPPTRIPGDEHGLRVVLPPGVDRSGTTVVLRFRYLGWPFTAQRVWR